MKKIYKTFVFLLISTNILAQNNTLDKASNNLTLDGNLEFVEENLIDAEVFYRAAISKDSMNNIASYNMANSFYRSGLNMEALNEYKSAIKKSKNKMDLHKSFHNLGDVYMQNKDYQNAVNAFKNALLNNPYDDETRYNYALARELLKNKDNKKDKKDDKKDDKKNKPKPNQISPEQLKNLLKAMNNEEKKVQDKVNKNKVKGVPVKNKKDW